MGLFSTLGSIAGGLIGSIVPGVGTAIGASIGGGLGGAVDGSKSAKSNQNAISAANTANQTGINNAITNNNASTLHAQQLFNPWIMNGTSAVNSQGDLLGLNGNTQQQSSIDALKASPLYQSLFGNGQNTLLANASATGGLRGGNTQGALANFGRDTLAQVIQNQLGNLGGLSQQGLTASGAAATIGQLNNSNNSNLLVGQGQANAGSILGQQAAGNVGSNQVSSALGGIDISGLLSGLGLGGSGGVSAPSSFNWNAIGNMTGANNLAGLPF